MGIRRFSPQASSASPPWQALTRRQWVELTAPGASIGVIGGLIAGGLAAMGGLSPLVTLVAGVALGAPLALAGAGYEILLARGVIPLGPITPVALYWFVAFPLARSFHAVVLAMVVGASVAVPHGWAAFLVYQVLVSVGFGIGFWWLHENFAPRWWFHLRERNPVAMHYVRLLHPGIIEARPARPGATVGR